MCITKSGHRCVLRWEWGAEKYPEQTFIGSTAPAKAWKQPTHKLGQTLARPHWAYIEAFCLPDRINRDSSSIPGNR
jgi:hypothetical protein